MLILDSTTLPLLGVGLVVVERYCTPEEYADGQRDPLNCDPDDRPIEPLLRQAGSRLLVLKCVKWPASSYWSSPEARRCRPTRDRGSSWQAGRQCAGQDDASHLSYWWWWWWWRGGGEKQNVSNGAILSWKSSYLIVLVRRTSMKTTCKTTWW